MKSASEFVTRIDQRNERKISRDEAICISLEYLKEECAIIMPMWAKMGFNIMIYPSNILDAMSKAYETIVKPNMGDNLTWLTLRFKRKIEKKHCSINSGINPSSNLPKREMFQSIK